MDQDAIPVISIAVPGTGKRTLLQAIEAHDNNYAWIRLVLAASVIYFHAFGLTQERGFHDRVSAWLEPVTNVGTLAVILFFFLSGLFVTQSLHRTKNVPRFVVQRALRIWPGYFACIVVCAILACAVAGDFSMAQFFRFEGFYSYIARNSIFDLSWYIQGVFTGHADSTINGPIHTLPMELKMYLVLALLGLCRFITRPALIVAGALLALIAVLMPAWLSAALPFEFFNGDYSRPASAIFLVGVAAYGGARWIRPQLWHGVVLAGLAALSVGVIHVALFLLTAVWIVAYLGQARTLPPLKSDLSYGIYLYGWPATQMVSSMPNLHLNPYVLSLSALLLASLFAAVSWHVVEKPAIALGKSANMRSLHGRGMWVMAVLFAVLASVLVMHWVTLRFDLQPVAQLETTIIDFGPHIVKSGSPFNVQADGKSALWLTVSSPIPDNSYLVVDGKRLNISGNYPVVTATAPISVFSHPGHASMYFEFRTPVLTKRSPARMIEIVK